MSKNKTSAKRKLSDIDFSKTGAHIALVSKDQGGPANGYDKALVLKASKNFSPATIEKMQQVRVTLELPDFLQKFFGMYAYEADELAAMLGYEFPEGEVEPETYQDYIESRVSSFEIMKSLYQAGSLASAISHLQEEEFLAVLEDQVKIEKSLVEGAVEESQSEEVGETKPEVEIKKYSVVSWGDQYGYVVQTTEGSDSVLIKKLEKSASNGFKPTDTLIHKDVQSLTVVESVLSESTKLNNEEVNMSDKTETKVEVELVEKAQFETVNKALEDTRVELQKAVDQLNEFKKERQELIEKARKDSLRQVVSDETQTETLFKALNALESDDDFVEVLEVIKALKGAAAEGQMFEEIGENVEEKVEPAQESGTAKILKARFAK